MNQLMKWSLVAFALSMATACGREPCTGGTNPEGTSCASSASVCNRNCICENGEEISAGTCTNNVCASVVTACTNACASYGYGGFTGQFCAARDL